MKRIIVLLVCLVLTVVFSACSKDAASSETLQTQNETSSVDLSNEQGSEETVSTESTSSNEASSEKTKSEASSSKPTTSSKPTKPSTSASSEKGTSSKTSSVDNTSSSSEITEGNIVDGVVGSVVDVGESEMVYGEDYGGFVYTGSFVGYATKGDIFYMTFTSPNMLVAYDTAQLEIVYEKTLPGLPSEIQVDETSLSIAYPGLKKIVVYDKNTFSQKKEYKLSNAVGSFCIDGDTIYYAEYDQHCRVYRTSITSGETVEIKNGIHPFYYEPKLYLSKEHGKLYIGETSISTCNLYCYDISNNSLVQMYSIDSYNFERTMFMIDGELYWAGMRFDPDNLSAMGEYGGAGSKYMYHVDENFVFLNRDVYHRESYQLVARVEQYFKFLGSTENMSLVIVEQSGYDHVVAVVH